METGLFTSEVLSALPSPTIVAVTPLTVPVKVGLLMGAFNPIWFDTVVAKLASDPIANASSFKVSNAAGALATKLLISVLTNSVVASWVVFVPVVGVGADGIPVNVGDAKLDFKSRALCCAVLTGLFASEVLSALPRPTIALEIPPTVPVKVGDAKLAFKSRAVCCAVLTGLFASEVLSAFPSPTIALEIPPTVPVKVGDAKGAFKSSAVCCAVLTGLFASDVLSALPRPTIAFEIPPTVPVKVGDSTGALRSSAVC